MNDFISLPQVDREFLIRSTAESMGSIPPKTIEKDYWVVWILEKLFTLDCADHLYFRGGTSLSQVYRVIERFSEDIDLGIDRQFYDFDDNELSACTTVSQSDSLIGDLNRKNREFLKGDLLEALRTILASDLPSDNWSLEFERDGRHYWLNFHYPQSLPDYEDDDDYIKPTVKIEIYNNQDNDPWQLEKIQSYISEKYPNELKTPECSAKVVSLGRTFWEKVALVHSYIERGTISADRFSRHLYDLYFITKSEYFNELVSDRDLLTKILKHRKIFYRQPSANYDHILKGKLNLVPNENLLKRIKLDYNKMDVMIYGNTPDLSDVIDGLRVIQQNVNESPAS